jgi:sensor c-di-GMP phosphodiesterase-like protein
VEGVETVEQARYFASAAQPILVQGWLYGHAVSAEEFLRLLAEDEKKMRIASDVSVSAMAAPVY